MNSTKMTRISVEMEVFLKDYANRLSVRLGRSVSVTEASRIWVASQRGPITFNKKRRKSAEIENLGGFIKL